MEKSTRFNEIFYPFKIISNLACEFFFRQASRCTVARVYLFELFLVFDIVCEIVWSTLISSYFFLAEKKISQTQLVNWMECFTQVAPFALRRLHFIV